LLQFTAKKSGFTGRKMWDSFASDLH